MRQQDILSILITFAVGLMGGGYLYIAHFANVSNTDDVATEEDFDDFSVIGNTYGSCGQNCPAFQVLADGGYRYQYHSDITGDRIIKEGTLPLDIQRGLKSGFDADIIAQQEVPLERSNCLSQTGGIDLRYQIVVDGEEFVIDSCKTNVDTASQVWTGLAKIWNYFETIK